MHPSVNGDFGYFLFMAVAKSIVMNTAIEKSIEIIGLNSVDIFLVWDNQVIW
jgi:hypothetical protein